MTASTYFHVAPAAAKDDILRNGLLPLSRQWDYRGDEAGALQAWVSRWAARMGRDEEYIWDALSPMGQYDIHRVCVFESLEMARAWAAADPADMVIFEIDGSVYDFTPDQFADEDEVGAWTTTDHITPDDLKVVE